MGGLNLYFWLDTLARKARIPYPFLFGLIGLVLYLLGIPVMIMTDNLVSFLAEPRWVFLAVYSGLSAIGIVFAYRKFRDSLDKIRPLVSSEEEFQGLYIRAVYRLTHWIYWGIVVFWIVLNLLIFVNPTITIWMWYGSYNQLLLVAVYYQIAMIPANVFGGMFMYIVPIGLTLAYREICINTAFDHNKLLSEWKSPFGGFRNLITLALLVAGISAILVLLLWTGGVNIFAYTSILVIVVPTLVFPHYYFHLLFSRTRTTQLNSIREELMSTPIDQEGDPSGRILLLLEEARIDRKKIWLIDIVTIVEILVVALMHVLLVEILTMLLHV